MFGCFILLQLMPMSIYTHGNMRMNVSQLLHEIGLNVGCPYNPEKQEIKEVSKNSMKYLMKSLTNEELKKENNPIAAENHQQQHLQQQPNDVQETVTPTVENQSCVTSRIDKAIDSENSKPPLQCATLNFIPYPDHNYGQQPPLTPPAENSSEPTSTESLTTFKQLIHKGSRKRLPLKQSEEQEGITKCICGFGHDDGFMISCDNCSSWQHIECMGIKSSKLPDKYLCHNCFPRELDVEKAKLIQVKIKENMPETNEGEEDDDDEGNEDTASEDDVSANKLQMYTAISNTPTRITLFTNATPTSQNNSTAVITNQLPPVKTKSRRSSRVQKRKLPDQRNTKKKARRKEKSDLSIEDADFLTSFHDSNSLTQYISEHATYKEIEENIYDEEFKNLHFNLPETVPCVDLKKAVKCYKVGDINSNYKGLLAICDIQCGNFICEYKGLFMSLKRFEELNPIFRRACPYLVCYSKIERMPITVDARSSGNDARFVRRSCSPNADFQHITINGVLHIIIVSKSDISENKEITIPFDYPIETYNGYLQCACNSENCLVKSFEHNDKTRTYDEKSIDISPQLSVTDVSNHSKIEIEPTVENETELFPCSEDAKNEKLSREERKLQAYLKQFEKLEKKQECVKKVKEPKTPVARTSTDENNAPMNSTIKTLSIKKSMPSKRKTSFNGKRRTRQSSCSSEPVSPADQDGNLSNISTPNTPVGSNTLMLHEISQFMKVKQKKEKEPITLTLPIQRKLKHDQHSLPTPTPPGTPLMQLSPAKYCPNSSSSLSLSVDTRSHSLLELTPVKTCFNSGLLQIAQQRILTSPRTPSRSFGMPSTTAVFNNTTCAETIGDITVRQESHAAVMSPNRSNCVFPPQPKYYGSMKKYWLQKHQEKLQSSQQISNVASPTYSQYKQLTIAAALASKLSCDQFVRDMPAPGEVVFKKPSNCIPLKRRYLHKTLSDTEKRNSNNSNKSTVKSTETVKPIKIAQSTETVKPIKVDHSPEIVKPIKVFNNSSDLINNFELKNDNNSATISHANNNQKNNGQADIGVKSEPLTTIMTRDCIVNSAAKLVSEETLSFANNPLKRQLTDVKTKTDNKKIKTSLLPANVDDHAMTVDLKSELPHTIIASTQNSNGEISIKSSEICSISNSINTSMNNRLEDYSPQTPSYANSTTLPRQTSRSNSPSNLVIYNRVDSLNTTPQASPRSSIDSNPDSEYGNGEHVTVKKKLSYKEYRNRIRSQKHSLSNNIPPLPPNDEIKKPPLPPAYIVTGNNDLIINSPSDKLLSKLEHTEDVSNVFRENRPAPLQSSQDDHVDTSRVNPLVSKNTSSKPSKNPSSVSTVTSTLGRSYSVSSELSAYEPVSPNDYESDNSRHDEPGKFSHSIHSEITKNPFSIHNDITKNPFGKKNPANPGLLQYLSAQKFPHLITNPTNGAPVNNSFRHQTEYSNGEVDKEDDESSTHSSMSSTSYNSLADMPHEKSFHSYRHYSRDHNSREHHPSSGRDHYNFQNYNVGGYPPSSNYSNFTHRPLHQHSQQQHHRVQRTFPITNNNNNNTNAPQTISTSSSVLPRQHQQQQTARPNQHRGYLPF